MKRNLINDTVTVFVENFHYTTETNSLNNLIHNLETVKSNLDKEHPEWRSGYTYIGHSIDSHGNLSLVIHYDRYMTDDEIKEREKINNGIMENDLVRLRELINRYPNESKEMLSV